MNRPLLTVPPRPTYPQSEGSQDRPDQLYSAAGARPPASDGPEFFTVAELADWLRVSKACVYRMVATRTVPFYKVGTAVRFERHEIEAHLLKRRVATAAERT